MSGTSRGYSFRVVWSDEDDAYVASCPEFEGISGFGNEPEQAMAEALEALNLAIETYEAEGWDLPKAAHSPAHSGQFRLRLPRSLHARLAQRAADEDVSLNSYAISLISIGLGSSESQRDMRAILAEQFAVLRFEIHRDVILGASPRTASVRSSEHTQVLTGGNRTVGGSAWPS